MAKVVGEEVDDTEAGRQAEMKVETFADTLTKVMGEAWLAEKKGKKVGDTLAEVEAKAFVDTLDDRPPKVKIDILG